MLIEFLLYILVSDSYVSDVEAYVLFYRSVMVKSYHSDSFYSTNFISPICIILLNIQSSTKYKQTTLLWQNILLSLLKI